MSDADFMFQLIAATMVLASFLGFLYGAYSKLIAPLVKQLADISHQMERFTVTLEYVDAKLDPMAMDINALQARVTDLEKTVAVIKEQIKHLKGE